MPTPLKADWLFAGARVVTLAPSLAAAGADAQLPHVLPPRRGATDMRRLGILARADVAVAAGRIVAVLESGADRPAGSVARTPGDAGPAAHQPIDVAPDRVIAANGRVLLPGFVDCHTHACWGGDRLDEFQMKLEGVGYLDILKAGGGIMSTVRATRAASEEQLVRSLVERIERMITFGSTTIEVKSGYGLNTETELKMLRAIDQARGLTPATLVPTALVAHAIDRDATSPEAFFERTIDATLPMVAEAFPGIAIDAYCEDGAWPLDATRRLFERARGLGCPIRIHVDQFNSFGAVEMALDLGAISVDHLEASGPATLQRVAASDAVAVLLPSAGFHVDDRYADGRALVDAGAAVAVATNFNPGSAPCPSMPFAIAAACRKNRLTPAEAITAATWNPACVLGRAAEVGSIEVGKRADLVLHECTDERTVGFEFATLPPAIVMINGRVVRDSRRGYLDQAARGLGQDAPTAGR